MNEGSASIELEHPVDQPLEHVTIVGDQQQPAPVRGKPLLEPNNAVDVKVVGGLVENEEVGWLDERSGEADPLGLAAREGISRPIEEVAHTEFGQHGLGFPRLGNDWRPALAGHGVEHQPGGEWCVLVEHRDPNIAAGTELTGLGDLTTGQNSEQCRLSRAVDANDPETVTSAHRQGDVGEEGSVRARNTDSNGIEQDHRRKATDSDPSSAPGPDRRDARQTLAVDSVPPLVVNPSGRGLRAIGLVVRGVRRVAKQVDPYTNWWSDQNQNALVADGPLWISIGDSTCLGIGASAAESGWVGRTLEALRETNPSWRVINLAMSGARLCDSLEFHTPIVEALVAAGHRPAITTACVGTNDVLWGRTNVTELRDQVEDLADRLPRPTVMATIAGSSSRVALTNRALKQAATDRDLALVDPWREPGPGRVFDRVAEDRFHPNDVGHQLMSDAFVRAIRPLLQSTVHRLDEDRLIDSDRSPDSTDEGSTE